MSELVRHDVNEEWVHAGMIEAGDFVFVGYCSGTGETTQEQINGAFDHLEWRLKSVGLSLASIVKMDAMFADISEIPKMEKVIRERFGGKYPVRKSFERDKSGSVKFQVDAIAYKG